jgi:hypothetical protein
MGKLVDETSMLGTLARGALSKIMKTSIGAVATVCLCPTDYGYKGKGLE